MKRILKMTAFVMLVTIGSSFQNDASAQYEDDYPEDGYYEDESYNERGDVSYQTFYDELSPHGNWVEYPGYGYVWQPRMSIDFRPYNTGGHWVWNNRHGWIWVSDYDWGWAPFHYGRWFHDPYYGWLWVPGYEWSGAWVTWRDGGDYYGWAPIRPGITISINFHIGSYSPPIDWWSFTPRRHIFSRNIYSHCIDYHRNVTIINHTTVINNYYYGDRYGFRTGPQRSEFERYTGRITPVNFRQSDRPGRSTFRDNEVSIYRPNVRQNNDRIAPRTFDRYDDNGTVRTNDTRVRGNGNNDFRRNNNSDGNVETSPRSNNLPRERSGRFERTEDPSSQDNGTIRTNPGNRRFDRNDNNPANQELRPDRPTRTNPPVEQNNERRLERRPNENSNDPVRQPQVRSMERRQDPQMQRQSSPQVERRQSQPTQQQAPRQFERRQQPQQSQQSQPRQVEQRQSPQPRQIEQRENPNNNNSSENGRGNGNGKRRF